MPGISGGIRDAVQNFEEEGRGVQRGNRRKIIVGLLKLFLSLTIKGAGNAFKSEYVAIITIIVLQGVRMTHNLKSSGPNT